MQDLEAYLQQLSKSFKTAPISKFIGWELQHCRDGKALVKLPFRKEFDQGTGVIHGGIIGMIADTAGYFAAASLTVDALPTTAEFKINLIAPAKLEALTAKAEVIKAGKSLLVCQLRVVGEETPTVAVGLGTYFVSRKSRDSHS